MPELSRIIHGQWRLKEWKYSANELLHFGNQLLELGINTFDHADIYGDYECETLFGQAIALDPSFRKKIKIISKCGIKLLSEKYPERTLKTYDYSYRHIIYSVEQSLKNLQTDYLDILLLHRPSPLLDPKEVARAFDELSTSGKVLNFGVSNFLPAQVSALKEYMDLPIITNQLEISISALEHFDNGNMDYCIQNKIMPMAWSPLAGGQIFHSNDPVSSKLRDVLIKIAEQHNVSDIAIICLAWLLKHPAIVYPVIGSGKLERIRNYTKALDIELSHSEWFSIYNTSKGKELP